jgi:8-oxo-dGTP pyrophosphatase MutT (NUDIX family)
MAPSVMKNITCAGGIFLARDTKRFLFLMRTHQKSLGTWGIAGGKVEPEDNTLYQALLREINEELGCSPPIEKTIPIELYESADNQFYYNTYVLITPTEFIPRLNEEHSGYSWVDIDCWPKPLHQGVKTTLMNRITRAKIDTIIRLIS